MDDEFSLEFRKAIRTYELERVCSLLPERASVLEVGAGAGWQAKALAERGFEVTAIDVDFSLYKSVQEWPVIQYDGKRIPLEDNSVDVVFSSNVLEHIPDISNFIPEMMRVLKPGGYMVHVMPTSLWRLITTITFYPNRVKLILSRLIRHKNIVRGEKAQASSNPTSDAVRKSLLGKLLLPTVHGVRGTLLTEIYYFSKRFWMREFSRSDAPIERTLPAGLLYSGYKLLGPLLPISSREKVATLCGSSCRVYVSIKKSA